MFFPMINFEVNVYHVAAELVVQEVSCHMSRKQIEQDPTVGTLMMGNMSTTMMQRWRKDKFKAGAHLESLHVELLVPGLQLPQEVQARHPLNLVSKISS